MSLDCSNYYAYWLDSDDANKVLLVDIHTKYYDFSENAIKEDTIRVSSKKYDQPVISIDDPWVANYPRVADYYDDVLYQTPTVRESIDSSLNVSNISFLNNGEYNDKLSKNVWIGCVVEIKLGDVNWRPTDFRTIVTRYVTRMTTSDNKITLTLSDISAYLDKNITDTKVEEVLDALQQEGYIFNSPLDEMYSESLLKRVVPTHYGFIANVAGISIPKPIFIDKSAAGASGTEIMNALTNQDVVVDLNDERWLDILYDGIIIGEGNYTQSIVAVRAYGVDLGLNDWKSFTVRNPNNGKIFTILVLREGPKTGATNGISVELKHETNTPRKIAIRLMETFKKTRPSLPYYISYVEEVSSFDNYIIGVSINEGSTYLHILDRIAKSVGGYFRFGANSEIIMSKFPGIWSYQDSAAGDIDITPEDVQVNKINLREVKPPIRFSNLAYNQNLGTLSEGNLPAIFDIPEQDFGLIYDTRHLQEDSVSSASGDGEYASEDGKYNPYKALIPIIRPWFTNKFGAPSRMESFNLFEEYRDWIVSPYKETGRIYNYKLQTDGSDTGSATGRGDPESDYPIPESWYISNGFPPPSLELYPFMDEPTIEETLLYYDTYGSGSGSGTAVSPKDIVIEKLKIYCAPIKIWRITCTLSKPSLISLGSFVKMTGLKRLIQAKEIADEEYKIGVLVGKEYKPTQHKVELDVWTN